MKISYQSIKDILSPREMKNVTGGSEPTGGNGGYIECYARCRGEDYEINCNDI